VFCIASNKKGLVNSAGDNMIIHAAFVWGLYLAGSSKLIKELMVLA